MQTVVPSNCSQLENERLTPFQSAHVNPQTSSIDICRSSTLGKFSNCNFCAIITENKLQYYARKWGKSGFSKAHPKSW